MKPRKTIHYYYKTTYIQPKNVPKNTINSVPHVRSNIVSKFKGASVWYNEQLKLNSIKLFEILKF